MKKFSLITERNINDFPDYWQDVLDYIELFKETNPVHFISSGSGFVTEKNLESKFLTQSISIISHHKFKEYLKKSSDVVPTNWKLVLRVQIGFKQLNHFGSESFVSSESRVLKENDLDRLVTRINSVKTLVTRISKWGEVRMNELNCGWYGTNVEGSDSKKPDISILFIFREW